jgi:hypothetical protein
MAIGRVCDKEVDKRVSTNVFSNNKNDRNMKNPIPTIALVLCTLNALSQIPNGGFEDWETVQNYEKPLLWQTNQDTNIVRFAKDTIRAEGAYSLTIIPGTGSAFWECRSIAWASAKLAAPVGDDQSLYFHARSIADNPFGGTYLEVTGKFFAGGTLVSNYEWKTFDEIVDFTAVELPIPSPGVDSLTINIFGGALNGATDGCGNKSFSWVDGFEIKPSTTTNIPEAFDKPQIIAFPNPVGDIVHFDSPNSSAWEKIEVFDYSGRRTREASNTNQLGVGGLPGGVYFVRLWKSGRYETKRILKK